MPEPRTPGPPTSASPTSASLTPGPPTPDAGPPGPVAELVVRSHRLGADPRNTNFAGGNTSVKAPGTDPVTGAATELLWVKGSGGDLGTLTPAGLAVLRLDRLRALVDVYPGVEAEDEMVAAFEFCRHGRGGAAPSIDTAMHALVDAPHVDHLHPDAGIALAAAADGEELTRRCFGDRVLWVPWRRPGFQLGLDIAAIAAANPQAIDMSPGAGGWVVGGGVQVLRWDGSSWLQVTQTATESHTYLYAVDIFSQDDVWAVGSYGALIHWDGVEWSRSLFPDSELHTYLPLPVRFAGIVP